MKTTFSNFSALICRETSRMNVSQGIATRMAWILIALLSVLTGTSAFAQDRPNIVMILADDLGLNNIGCYGSDQAAALTPNIDNLAATGIRFTQCYAEPVCGPSRATFNTGRYVLRNGALSNGASQTEPKFPNETALAQTLKQAGYKTGMAGKWFQMTGTPGDWGYDEWLSNPTADGYYWVNSYTMNGPTLATNVTTPNTVYFPDVCMDYTKAFFQQHANEPFFFYFPTHLVHISIQPTPDSNPPPPNGWESITDWTTATNQSLLNQWMQDNVRYLDKQVGQIVAELERLGLREKTLILFAGDNGTGPASTGNPLRYSPNNAWTIGGRTINGKKATTLEGGSRVPFIANWPGTTPSNVVKNDLVDFTDFYPTFMELTGTPMPRDRKYDGHSFAPQVQGETGTPRDWVYVQMNEEYYVREQGYKLNHLGELYDMSDAPFVEALVPANTTNALAIAARQRLNAALAKVNPAFSDGLIWFPFNETAGTNSPDAAGAYTARLSGFTTENPWVAGRWNKALQLNGTNQFATITGSLPPDGANARTSAAWIKTSASGPIISWGESGGTSSGKKWLMQLKETAPNAGALRLEVRSDGFSVAGTRDLRDGQWHHVAAVLPQGAAVNGIVLYVDGVIEPISATLSRNINTGIRSSVNIGTDVYDAAITPRYFNGAIDEVRIYNRALPATEIAALYAGTDQSALAWHRFQFGIDPVNWTADDDLDGRTRLLEYALGTQPYLADTNPLSLTAQSASGYPQLRFPRRLAGTHELTYKVESTTDLVNWTEQSTSETAVETNATSGFETPVYQPTAPLSSQRSQFLRLKVTQP